MEIIKSRYGLDRSVEKVDHETFRVMGQSEFVRVSENKNNKISMFDFEGGPCLTVGGKIKYGNMNWKIENIEVENSKDKTLSSCVLKVKPMF
jgi:hypothetical protein